MADGPGPEGQHHVRNGFRIAGGALVALGGILLVIGVGSLLSTMNSDSMVGPRYFWLAFVGMPLLAVGGWCLQAGFLGAATRYVAGEVGPVLSESLPLLTGEARHCAQCGHGEDVEARFCSSCGTPLG